MSDSQPPLQWYRSVPPAPPRRRFAWRSIPREHKVDALGCFTVATLCFSQAARETLFRADADFYSRLPLAAPTLVAFTLSVLALTAIAFACLKLVRRHRRLAAFAATAALLLALNFVRITYPTIGGLIDTVGRPGLLAAVVLALAASIVWPAPGWRVVRRIVFVLSPVALLTLAIALWMMVEVAAGPKFAWVEPARLGAPSSPPSLRRVVWIVFGELDQALTFETRPPGLELPELDRFRRESVYADAAHPPAGATEISMPALITGRPVVAVRPLSPIDLELSFADGKTARWSAAPNVFMVARGLGYDTAVVGSHLPYPRILGRSLGAAAFRSSGSWEQTRADTVHDAFLNHWASLAAPWQVRRVSAARFSDLGEMAFRAATDGRFGVVLLHLPLPRGPGIYDRATGRLTAWNFAGADAAYLDNLALVDRIVGELRRGIERARLGDRTWIVVSSDRWRGDDRRVPFLVRPPDGGRPAHVDGAFSTLGTQTLVLAILRGAVTETADVVTWLTRHMPAPPRRYTSEGRPIY